MRKTAVLGLFLAFSGPAIAQAQIDWGLATGQPRQPGPVYQSIEPRAAAAPEGPARTVCFIKGERESGQNKMCFYDCFGSEIAQNIPHYGVCATQIQR